MARTGIGSIIDGKYEVIAPIGHGGMSEVWLARDSRLKKLWAIKEIKPNVGGAQGAANRQAIIDEANFMKTLDYTAIPRVVDILDYGATIFVVMDYVEGRSLQDVMVSQGGPFEQDDVIDWGLQICDVLIYLHHLDPLVVYRDMKPENVMLRDDGVIKVIDFGIAMEYDPSRGSDETTIGTYGYGPPEQLDPARPTDLRADVYALGATLYTLVTGHVPRVFTASDGTVTVDFDMRPIREWNPQLSQGLEQVILAATQSDPDERYQTVEEMRYDLEHYREKTDEYLAMQRQKVATFRRHLIWAGVFLALGIVLLVARMRLRTSTYESYLHEASVASTDEVVTVGGDGTMVASASPAEESYLRAISLEPDNPDAYRHLIDNYKSDFVFTPSEADRWNSVFSAYGQSLQSSDQYAQICFDAGILYLCYLDYDYDLATGSTGAGVTADAGAVASARRSEEWFRRAQEAYERAGGGVLSEADYEAAGTYLVIARFYNEIHQRTAEGTGSNEAYADFWDALVQAVETLDSQDEPAVRLRLYRVAFQAIAAPSYLNGFSRAGVTQEEVAELLETVELGTQALEDDVDQNEDVLLPIYEEIVNGYGLAQETIGVTYSNPVSRLQAEASSRDSEGMEGEE